MTSPILSVPALEPYQLAAADNLGVLMVEVDDLVRASAARSQFAVSGKGLSVAILDTGIRQTHIDFAGRIVDGINMTSNNGGDRSNVRDGNGHGTNVAGIVAANGRHLGIAPNAGIIPVKVVENIGFSPFDYTVRGLEYVLEKHEELKIGCVCASIGDGDNHTGIGKFGKSKLLDLLAKLEESRVPVIIAAGNFYHRNQSRQGMCFPAISSHAISVGAVYDDTGGEVTYQDGAVAFSTKRDAVTPFSQRLHGSFGGTSFTTIFAPGAPVLSTGISSDEGSSVQNGTSQAAPVVAGVVLLMQEYWLRLSGTRPTVAQIRQSLREGAITIFDGDDEHDNVQHSNLSYLRVDAIGALRAMARRYAYSSVPVSLALNYKDRFLTDL